MRNNLGIKTRRRAVLQNRRRQDKAQRESRSVFRSGVVNMMEVRLAERFIRVLFWAKSLDPGRYHVAYTSFMNQRNDPPEIMWITKK